MSTSKELETYRKYIDENVHRLIKEERQQILQILCNSGARDNIQTKGDGSLILWKHIPRDTTIAIYTFVQNKLDTKVDESDIEQ